MKALGFDLKKGELRFSLLQGTLACPAYVTHGRRVYDPNLPRKELMNWFKQNFDELIKLNSPDIVAYRVSLNANSVAQTAYLLFPWGILNLIAFNSGLSTSECNKQSFTAKRFSLEKGSRPESIVDQLIGTHAPHWDDSQKNSVLAAWAALKA